MKQSIALSMNPLVKVAVALIVGMAFGRYALSAVMGLVCRCCFVLGGGVFKWKKTNVGQLGTAFLGGFGWWFVYGKC